MSDRLSIQNRTALLGLRSRVFQSVRRFFLEAGFIEVETPVLIPAPAPETHIDAIPAEGGFLQTSPELCMKRLLAEGFDRIFQICRCFRRSERGQRHLPEFTMLEWYRRGSGYADLMADCEGVLGRLARELGTGASFQGLPLDLTPPWAHLSVAEAFERHGGIPLERALTEDRFDEIMACQIEPRLGYPKPTFLYDYPACLGALARLKPSDRRWAERFELYIGGVELANGFSELTDPIEQRRRFEEERRARIALGKPVYPWPERFLQDLEKLASTEAAGIALGMDRLTMVFADRECIDDIIAFAPEKL